VHLQRRAYGEGAVTIRFSLVLATVGRTNELERFLSSLDSQSNRAFELVVVDQNKDQRLAPILEPYQKKLSILHCVSRSGLSRARNVGLEHATGSVVSFPDDDCWYPPDLLERVALFFCDHPEMAGLSGRLADRPRQVGESCAEDQKNIGAPRFDRRAGLLDKANVWRRTCSVTLFLKSSVVGEVGEFDESLGLGAGTLWAGGEDIDYPLRALKAGFRIYYSPDLVVFHPTSPGHDPSELADRGYRYGAGIGRVWRKNSYPVWLVVYHLSRPVGGALLNLVRGRLPEARYHLAAFRGRLRGWRSR